MDCVSVTRLEIIVLPRAISFIDKKENNVYYVPVCGVEEVI